MIGNSKVHQPFVRHLPGGGFVAIEVSPAKSIWRKPRFRGRVIVERRAASRAGDHQPPVIATASGPSLDDVVKQLFHAAQSNATIASALLHLGVPSRETQPAVTVASPGTGERNELLAVAQTATRSGGHDSALRTASQP